MTNLQLVTQTPEFFVDENWQDSLVWHLWKSSAALGECAHLLKADDFKPRKGAVWGRPRWIVAGCILEHYEKHQKALRAHLRAEVLDYGQNQLGFGERQMLELKEYLQHLDELKPAVRETVLSKVVRFKGESKRAEVLDRLIDLQAASKLTEQDWHKATVEAWPSLTADKVEDVPKTTWPAPIGKAALRGLVGDFVRLVEPHTEADPAALLVQCLVAVGNVIGRKSFFEVEASRHHMNLFAAIVGKTSKGRKGTSWDHVKLLLQEADREWVANRLPSGLASGEGLIYKCRDATHKKKRSTKKEAPGTDALEIVDEGVDDKRLMVVEPEFARVLQVSERDTNTLSPIMRQAWDTGTLETATRNQPLSAHDAHISIIGHITEDELRRRLTDTAKANGFANRFLWVCAERSKILSRGGSLSADDMRTLQGRVDDVVEFAKRVRRMTRSKRTWKLWDKVYPTLSGDRPGMAGVVTARAEAQVTRLSCLYALLDKSTVVLEHHLRAALEVWRYCEESARYIFGDTLGNPVADEILNRLRQTPNGLTRNEIRLLFQRNKSSAEIDQALAELAKYYPVTVAKETTTEGQKRPAERWILKACTA